MTDLTVPPLGPDPDDPDDQHLALITALIKIFAADPTTRIDDPKYVGRDRGRHA